MAAAHTSYERPNLKNSSSGRMGILRSEYAFADDKPSLRLVMAIRDDSWASPSRRSKLCSPCLSTNSAPCGLYTDVVLAHSLLPSRHVST